MSELSAQKAREQAAWWLAATLPVPEYSWQWMSVDLMTQLPITKRGHDAIIVPHRGPQASSRARQRNLSAQLPWSCTASVVLSARLHAQIDGQPVGQALLHFHGLGTQVGQVRSPQLAAPSAVGPVKTALRGWRLVREGRVHCTLT